jgi:hypothetical protein
MEPALGQGLISHGETVFFSTTQVSADKAYELSYNFTQIAVEDLGKDGDTLSKSQADEVEYYRSFLASVFGEVNSGDQKWLRHTVYFSDSSVYYQTLDGEIKSDYTITDYTGNKTYVLSRLIPGHISNERKIEQNIEDSLEITEYRNDRKNILGYDCFKITVKYPPEDDEEFEMIFGSRIKEMYVTDQFIAKSHPVEYSGQILSKYFPLELKDYNANQPQMITYSMVVKIKVD